MWSAAPGAHGNLRGPVEPGPGRESAFVRKLRDYGSGSVQRLLHIDWVKLVHNITNDIFRQEGRQGALGTTPAPPITYGQATEYVVYRLGRLPRGRGSESFGSTLADCIFTEISARAETCKENVHYKVIDNHLAMVPPGLLRGTRARNQPPPMPPARQ